MITIVVASFGALSQRRVIVPRQSKQVTSSSRQHQKLRFPSAMAASPNGMSDTSNSGWRHRIVKKLLFMALDTQLEKRQASDCLIGLCFFLLHCVQADGPHQPPSQPVWSWPFSSTICGGKECWSFASISLWSCSLSCRGVYVHCKWNIHCTYKGIRVFRCLGFLVWKVITSWLYRSIRLSERMKQLDSYWKNQSEILQATW